MFTFYRTSGIIIPKKYIRENFYKKIKDQLTRRTKNYNSSDYTTYYFYLENNKSLLIPRFFPLDKYIKDYKIVNKSSEGKTIKIEHNITPKNNIQELTIDYMLKHENGIIELQPRVGKTIISIFMIAKRKKKSLIIVHRDSLADQWCERFLEFTDLKVDDISRLKSSTFKKDLEKSIIISSSQTFTSLLKKNRVVFLNDLHKANIGIFIGDEIHTTVGAPTFSECSIHIPAKINFGLSATPYRQDGNTDIMSFHLGETFSSEDISGTMIPKITVILNDFQIDTPRRFNYLYWGGNFQRSRYLNLIKKSKSFMDISKSLLTRLKEEKRILFICERIKLIDELYNWIDTEDKSKFISGSKNKELEKQITFSTPGKIRDGVDAISKDTLIITSPILNISQICGRVLASKEGKAVPIIIDMVDIGCKRISNTFYKRLNFYHKKEWEVQFIFIDNKLNKHIVEEIEALNIINGD